MELLCQICSSKIQKCDLCKNIALKSTATFTLSIWVKVMECSHCREHLSKYESMPRHHLEIWLGHGTDNGNCDIARSLDLLITTHSRSLKGADGLSGKQKGEVISLLGNIATKILGTMLTTYLQSGELLHKISETDELQLYLAKTYKGV